MQISGLKALKFAEQMALVNSLHRIGKDPRCHLKLALKVADILPLPTLPLHSPDPAVPCPA